MYIQEERFLSTLNWIVPAALGVLVISTLLGENFFRSTEHPKMMIYKCCINTIQHYSLLHVWQCFLQLVGTATAFSQVTPSIDSLSTQKRPEEKGQIKRAIRHCHTY